MPWWLWIILYVTVGCVFMALAKAQERVPKQEMNRVLKVLIHDLCEDSMTGAMVIMLLFWPVFIPLFFFNFVFQTAFDFFTGKRGQQYDEIKAGLKKKIIRLFIK